MTAIDGRTRNAVGLGDVNSHYSLLIVHSVQHLHIDFSHYRQGRSQGDWA